MIKVLTLIGQLSNLKAVIGCKENEPMTDPAFEFIGSFLMLGCLDAAVMLGLTDPVRPLWVHIQI